LAQSLLYADVTSSNGVSIQKAKEAIMSPKKTAETAQQWQDMRRDDDLHQIRAALQRLRFGSVKVIVQDGAIVQVDRSAKIRLQRANVAAKGNCSR